MPLPLIPIVAIGAGAAVAGTGLYAGVTSFFNSREEEEKVNSVVTSDLSEEAKVVALAYNNGVNPNSSFQKPGEGWFSDYSQSMTNNYQNTQQDVYNVYNITESPNATIDTQTTQKTDNTQTTTEDAGNPFSGLLSALGGSAIPVIALVGVGGYLLLKGGKK